MTTSCVFISSDYVISFWYSHLHVLMLELNRKKTNAESALFSTGNPMFPGLENRRWTAPIQSWFSKEHRCSVLNVPEKISADQRWCCSCSLNLCWKTSHLWNSAIQRWSSLGLHLHRVCIGWKFSTCPTTGEHLSYQRDTRKLKEHSPLPVFTFILAVGEYSEVVWSPWNPWY